MTSSDLDEIFVPQSATFLSFARCGGIRNRAPADVIYAPGQVEGPGAVLA